MRGGSKKGAYRLFLNDDSTAVAYVWAESENCLDRPAGVAFAILSVCKSMIILCLESVTATHHGWSTAPRGAGYA